MKNALIQSLLSLILILLTTVLYYPVAEFEFLNFDDNDYITENPHVNTGLSAANIKWAFTDTRSGHWHPLSWISHMLDVSLFGMSSGKHHLVNVGLHAANVALLFLFFAAATKEIAAAFFIALIIALHPMRIESVAWVTERKDVLSIFFAMLLLVTYGNYTRKGGLLRYLLCLLFFALGLLSKPMLTPFPVLLLLLDIWPLSRMELKPSKKWRPLILEKIPFLVLSLLSSAVTIFSQNVHGALKSLAEYPLDDRIANAFTAYLAYAAKLFWPRGLAIFYPFERFSPGIGAGAFLGFLAISFCCLKSYRQHLYLSIAWLWFAISLLPVIGFIQFGGQAFGDRWSYIPHIGLVSGLTYFFIAATKNKLSHAHYFSISSLIALVCFFYTSAELQNWRNSEAIFRHNLELTPDNFMAHLNLGHALEKKNDIAGATEHYQMAHQLRPTYPPVLNNLGGLKAKTGDYPSAEMYFRKALQTSENFSPARYNLGLIFANIDRDLLALSEWVRTLASDPEYESARKSIKFVLARRQSADCRPVPGDYASKPFLASDLAVLRKSLENWAANGDDQSLKSDILFLINCYSQYR